MKIHFPTGAVWIALLALATSSATADTRMQVSAASTPVRTQPSSSAPQVGRATSGEILFVARVEGDWAAVSPPDRLDVWLNKDFIEGNRVIAKSIQIRSGPGVQHDIVGTLERGAPVMPRGEEGDWCKIAPPSSVTLWVAKSDLSEITARTTPIREVAVAPKPAPPPEAPAAAPAPAPESRPAPAPEAPAPSYEIAQAPAAPVAPIVPPSAPVVAPQPPPAPPAPVAKVAPSNPKAAEAQAARSSAPAPTPAEPRMAPAAPMAASAAPARPVTETARTPAPPPPVSAPAPQVAPPPPPPVAPTLRPATAIPGPAVRPVATNRPAPAPRPAAKPMAKPSAVPAAKPAPVAPTVPAPAAVVVAQKSKNVDVTVDQALVDDLDLDDSLPGQGKSVQVEGELRNAPFMAASPSRYRLVDTDEDGVLEMVCHIHGDSGELREYIGQTVSIRGREYWVEESDMPVVVVGKIVSLEPEDEAGDEPVMY